MKQEFPFTRDLVLIGGGHTHALVLRKWGMRPMAGVRVTVINPGPSAPYSGMLPGFVAGHYTRDELDIDLVQLCRFAGARLINGAAVDVDTDTRRVKVAGRPDVAYDVLSIDVGITSAMPALDGFAKLGTPAKPLGPFADKWRQFLTNTSDPQIAVIGGGVAGAELAMAMRFATKGAGSVTLIDRSDILTDLGADARDKITKQLSQAGITVRDHTQVTAITPSGVETDQGTISAGFTTGAAGAKPHDWVAGIGVACRDGFVTVQPTLQSSDPVVFAVGDCADMAFDPRPKAGVYAVRQAPVLFENLQAILSGRRLRTYAPQKGYLKLISLGGKSALAEKFGRAFNGPLMWRWKDRIDRKFMDQFSDLPQMVQTQAPLNAALGVDHALGDAPMCGGCGAKVGRGALRDALAELPNTDRADVQAVAGDDAATLITGGQRQVFSTDHLRAFVDDPVVMTRIAAIHALGDIWAMGAAPQAATATIILPRMSAPLQRRTMSEIMHAAHGVMTTAGAAIVGGHSSLGAELTIGFSVTGLCDAAPITLAGAQTGDVLILTKPIGTGVIMAAEMVGRAQGHTVIAALDAMQQDQAAASAILHGAHAMTDVTGFGLAGHLAGICEASGVGAELDLDAIPILDGALDLATAGHRSSLFDDNQMGSGAVTGVKGAKGDLLFDPQTAGGLLAAIPSDSADRVLALLLDAGYPAAKIGRIVGGAPVVTVR